MKTFFFLFASCLMLCSNSFAQTNQKHRVVVLTDIEADPDDTQSLVRLLLYANQIDIKGLVATTSCWLQSEVIENVGFLYHEITENQHLDLFCR